jgi:hypothetical protein
MGSFFFHHRRVSSFVLFAVLGSLLGLAPGGHPAAQPADTANASAKSWEPAGDDLPPTKDGRPADVKAERYEAFSLDRDAIRTALAGAPAEGTLAAKTSPVEVSLPAPDGKLQRFAVYDSPVMEPELAAKYPDIKTYAGRGVDEPTSSIRFGLTRLGLHATVMSERGSWSIDPYYHLDPTVYASYWSKDAGVHEHGRDRQPPVRHDEERAEARRAGIAAGGGLVTRREYRIAITNDPNYATFFGGSDANVLSAKTALVDRMNAVYNDDLAIKMILVAGTDLLNLNSTEYNGANGPCGQQACFSAAPTNGCDGQVLTENRIVVGQIIGASNYDVGHIVLGVDGGGLAGLGVVGRSEKAEGCTGLATPTGDFFAIDYVAHEVGHQFSANHTFNGTQGNCSGFNRNAGTSVEPGSGSSVMAYAGICGNDNLQPHSDPYFSQRSIEEIKAYVGGGAATSTEVQNASFYGFGAPGDSFQIGFGANTSTSFTIANYTAANIDTAIQSLTGINPTVTGFGGTAPFDSRGFQVTFNATDVGALSIVNPVGFTSTPFVGETVQGGQAKHGGSTTVATGNHAPDVTAPSDATIPFRTPFALTATATDAESDPIVYLWEQNNIGPTATALFTQPKASGPLFRQFGLKAEVSDANSLLFNSLGENAATTDPTRVFPDIAQIAADKTNAASGSCSTTPTAGTHLDCYSEFLPGSVRTMNFRVTARDREPDAGGEANDEVALTVANAGPFRVTSHAASSSLNGGSSTTVTWNVANTDIVLGTANVRISFSTDGGLTFPTVVLASTPNDGSQVVTVPSVSTTQGRFKVEAVNNVYFDISKADLTVSGVDTTPPQTTITSGPADGGFTNNTTPTFTFIADETATFECAVDSTPVACSGNGTHTTSALSAGQHTFSVAATDTNGNEDLTPASRTFTVDVTPPTATIDTGPADASTTGSNVTFTFSANETSTFQCKMDTDPFDACSDPDSHSPSGLSTGSHTFSVKPTDIAGNAGTTVSRTWNVDATAPVVTIDSGPKRKSRKRGATFTFHSDDPNDALACSLDGSAFVACTSPKALKVKPKRHTFQVRATNALGNVGFSAIYSWKVLRK